jgi:uncharacterized protein YecT (DUF1311 family)
VTMMRAMVLLVCGLGVCGVARAASFDCKVAKTDIERAICSDKDLSAADDRMAAAYKATMAMAPAEVQTEIREDQRTWVRSLTTVCKSDAVELAHTPARRAELVSCLKDQYKAQTTALQQRVVKKGGIVFVMRSVTVKVKDAPDDTGIKDVETNPGYGTLTATWPQALSDAPEWAAWNAAMLLEAQKMSGGDGKTAGGWKSEWAQGTDTDVTAMLENVTSQMVSANVANDTMGHGAAHPNEAFEQFYWLLTEKRRLQATDVFAAGSSWEKVIAAKCRESLKEQVGDDYESYAGTKADFAKTLRDVIVTPENWEIDEKGITVDFPEYSVTPRAQPVEPVLVPWSALQADLARGFVVPQ